MTDQQAMHAANLAYQAVYGKGGEDRVRLICERYHQALNGTPQVPDGWITASNEQAADALVRLKQAAAVTGDILAAFKPRKTGGGWTAYANDKTMTEWREQAMS